MKLKQKSSFWFYSFIFTVLILSDQFSKFIVSNFFLLICNRGIAFGIGESGLLLSSAALFLVSLLVLKEKNKRSKILLTLILGAGASNLLDRLVFGCVRDFINVGIIPTFNFADLVITIGVISLLFDVIRKKN